MSRAGGPASESAAHDPCGAGVECPCASDMGNKLLRELLEALGYDAPARPEAPRLVWAEALRRIKHGRWSFSGSDF